MWTGQPPARTFMCPRRGGAVAVTLPPRLRQRSQLSLRFLRAAPSVRTGPDSPCSAPSGHRLVPGGIRCPSFQQAALQIVPGAVKLPEPSEQSSPGTDGRDCGCLRHNLGTAVSAFPQSIHAMCNGTRPCGPRVDPAGTQGTIGPLHCHEHHLCLNQGLGNTSAWAAGNWLA